MMGTASGGANPQTEAPRKHPDSASRVYDGEAFIVLPQSHQYKILNQVGTRVWELIDGTRTVDDMANIIASEYEVSIETAHKDVSDFISDLKENGMLANSDNGKVA
ncbi:MAG TPA: PqqD family protein [Candidatus Polarisedimenticolia bacterium]|jgi:hypothetical protein